MMVYEKKRLLFLLKFLVLPVIPIISVFMTSPAVAEVPLEQGVIQQQASERASDQSHSAMNLDTGGQPLDSPTGRTIRVGLYENKPKIYTGENGEPAGIFIGILEEIARREKWRLTYVPCNWPECLEGLEKGVIDLMPDVAFSPERAEKFDFNREEVVESWSQLYTSPEKPARNWRDLNGRRIALLEGSIQKTVLQQMMNGFGYKLAVVETRSYEEAFALAVGGEVDAVISNHFFGDYYCREYGLEKTTIVFNPVSLYFATARGADKDLFEAIDSNLRAMKSEAGSVYYRELARWMERPPKVVAPRYLVWSLGGIGGLLLLAFVLILILRGQVRIRTRHLAQANRTLRESEEKFRAMFQNHTAVKLIIDPDNGNIIEANQAAVRFYGWPEEQLRRMRIQEINLLPPEQVAAVIEKARAEQCVQFEFRHRLADGSVRDVEVFSSSIDIKGKKLLHSIVHDITEHRRIEAQYRQAQKMEAVGRLAGGVAHDYNNFLNVIIGYSELALLKLEPESPLREDLKQIHAAAEHSRDITRQLLAFARTEVMAPEVLDLNATVDGLLEILRQLVGEDIDLVWKPGSRLWPVLIDAPQFSQILANLCVNARDAIADVGKITIETNVVTFDGAYCSAHAGFIPGDYVLLAVSDDGCGMSQETLDRIFDPFFTTKEVGQGTGLGLATVYGIVKQNKGFIHVDSEPGKGAVFRIYLPRYAGYISEKRQVPDEDIQQGSGETILVVEDNVAILNLAEKILANFNYRVVTAQTPSAALRMAEMHADELSLLITDVVMPEMNGRELAEKIKPLCPDIKCLYMSGYTANIIAHRGVLNKEFQFIDKPFSVKDLANKVRAVLDETVMRR